MDGARTGLTSFCAKCGSRTDATSDACPVCGGELVELRPTSESARRTGLRTAKPGEFTRADRALLFSAYASLGLPVGLIGVLFGVTAFGLTLDATFLAWLTAVAAWASSTKTTPTLLTGTRPAPPPATTRPDAVVRVEGVLRAKTSVPSPVEGSACVAARVRGRVGTVTLDDALLVAFDVETDGGERVEVPDGPATVKLRVGPPLPLAAPTQRLVDLAAERGLTGDDVSAAAAEAILRDGDRVVVEGAVEERPGGSDGYRSTTTRRAIVEAPGVVRVIRRA